MVDCFQSFMAKFPAGSSLLFGALADSGRLKQRKNGGYRMLLDGVDDIDWFTERPDREEGTWKTQKLVLLVSGTLSGRDPPSSSTMASSSGHLCL